MAGAGKFLAGAGLGAGVTALIAALTSKPAQAAENLPDQEVRQALATVLTLLGNVQSQLNQIEIKLGVPPEALMTTEIQHLVFSQILLAGGVAGSAAKIYDDAPFAGMIKEVKIHWPDRCNGLVGIAVWHGTTQFLPKTGFLALNNAIVPYVINEPILDAEKVWVDMYNQDAVFPHQPTVTVRVEREVA